MKLGELNRLNEARRDRSYNAVLDEVNRIYMANRGEFETTTVCENGVVVYVHGKKPLIERAAPATEPPAWKIGQMEARIRSYERAYKC